MTPNSAVRGFVLCGLTAVAMGQQNGPQYSVAGMVVDSANGEPIKRAQVVLIHFDTSEPGAPNDRGGIVEPRMPVTLSTFTDSAGVFRFSAIPAGNCSLSAQKPGFTPVRQEGSGGLGAHLNLSASVEDARLGLTRLGVITGKVVDQEGQPIRGVNIMTLSRQMVDGMGQTRAVRNVVTDDRGIYRIWNLTPGKYYVKAAGRNGATLLYAGDVPPLSIADQAFTPTYFGGGKTLDAAEAIHIEAGTQASADLNLTMQPAYKIRGSLGNFVPRRTVKFELLSGDEDVSASRVSVNGDTGTFEIMGVLPGSYTVHATQNDTSAEVPISLGPADVYGLAVQLSPGVDIHVHRQLTNSPKEPETSEYISRIRGSGFCNVSFHPPGRRAGPSYTGRPSASTGLARGAGDELLLSGVLPGSYRTAVQCYGGYPRSVVFGTQDLLVNPALVIQPGAALPSIEILATQGGGTVNGTVSIERAKKDATIAILLVPQFTPSVGPVTTTNNSGSFRFDSLAPGSYAAYAFSGTEEIEFRNPAFLQSLTGGVNIQVEDNQEKTITIPGLVR